MFNKIMMLLGLAIALPAAAINHGHFFQRQSQLERSLQPNHAYLKLRPDGSFRSQQTLFFNQALNHADPRSITFKQRYFLDSSYASGAAAPVFYVICGEWNCAGTGSYSFIESLAKKFKAHLVAIEHRFYGESLPTNRLTTANLRTLNLATAIADLANLQKFVMEKHQFKGKWVAVGGSYAGTLAAFYRLKHPELVVGSLASSAPVYSKNEFFEYDAHVAKVINQTSCGDRVREAVSLIEDRLRTTEGEREVKALFKATDVTDNVDFLYVVADMLAAAVQYGREKSFCDALGRSNDLVKGYAKAGLTIVSAMGTTPFGMSLAVAQEETVTPDDNMRQWLWQSCREFGWFQVANGQGFESSRSAQVDLEYHEKVCRRLYGISMGQDGILNGQWYNELFLNSTSNIIFTNGSNDPWLTLSVTENGRRNRNFDLLMMAGAAHCNDLKLTNFPAVLEAHGKIERIIGGWL